jgi:hypothetical protein
VQFELINTYVSDPAHIAPSRSDANSNGHFPPANGHQPAGTPRGFNLSAFNMNGMFPLPGFGHPGQFPAFFGGHAVQAATGWAAGGGDDRGGGPVRRGGGRFTNQRTGPYDRRPRDQRWGIDNGRLSPQGGRSGRPGASGAGRWGDGAGGGAAAPPREAVAGRSLKSYEDLDAVAGAAGGELNY